MSQHRKQLWDEFLAVWPPERLLAMTIEEYTSVGTANSFIWWLESKVSDIGSVWGGSAFKFGIYERYNTEEKESKGGRIYSDKYAWYEKYGQTAEKAYETVKERVVSIMQAAQAGNVDAIDEIDFSEAIKWKIAFLYQPRDAPKIINVFNRDMVLFAYRHSIDPNASRGTPMSLMYSGLLDLKRDDEGVLELGERLWTAWEHAESACPQFWAIPLRWLFDNVKEIELFLAKDEVTTEDIPEKFNKLLAAAEVREKDHLALLVDENVRALAKVTNAESGDYGWTQESRNFVAPLASIPTDRAKSLTQAEITQIWQAQAPPVSTTPEPAEKASPPPHPKNVILYGPPGTGKTYHTIQRALELILGSKKVEKMSRETQARQFRELQREGRIEFVTFHQNYGYEEFVEGLRPVISEAADQEVLYEIHDGVFKRIALRAAANGLPAPNATATSFETLWRVFIDQLRNEGHRVVKSASGIDYALGLSSRDNVKAFRCKLDENGDIIEQASAGMLASRANSKLIWDHREALGPKPEDVTSDKTQELFAETRGGAGGHHYTALWPVYKALWELHREIGSSPETPEDAEARAQEVIDKPTPGTAEFAFTSKTKQHVLVIDEINRGNISKILGELITLLEPEKRLGQPEELKLPLAYTPEHRFGVPPNLHIIGTMNTADRSIALMDVALRRRFTFEEMMPDAQLISEVVGKASGNAPLGNLSADLFNAMNARIRFLYDRDHQIGHAYFLKVRSLDDLRLLFVDKLVPLLQEYFYEAWDKIGLVLGCPYDESGKPARSGPMVEDGKYVAPIIQASPLGESVIYGWENEDYEPRLDYEMSPALKDAETSVEDLLSYFIGVGNFNAEEREHYREMLTHLEKASTDEEEGTE